MLQYNYRKTYINSKRVSSNNLFICQMYVYIVMQKKLCFSASTFEKNRYIEKKNGLNKRNNRWEIGE